MLERDYILELLAQVQRVDPEYQRFGVSAHRYRLNPPLSEQFVRQAEQIYGFALPEDYVHFLTHIANGGAGPDYGVAPFEHFLKKGDSRNAERFRQAYRDSLSRPFLPRPMLEEEADQFAIVTLEGYRKNPERYFVYLKEDGGDFCDTDGFLTLGTHGCQWDFGLITAGPYRGKVFDTDNEGGYALAADSFTEFYSCWLDHLADLEACRKEAEFWRSKRKR